MIVSKKDLQLGKNMYVFGKKKLIYCRFRVKGKEIRRSTGKTTEALAREVAWQIYCDEAGINATKTVALRRSTYPTVNELLDLYKAKAGQSGINILPQSIYFYSTTLRKLLRIAGLPDNVRLDKISGETANAFRAAYYRKRGLVFGRDIDLSLNLTLNSILKNAKSIFSKAALSFYKQSGMVIPPSIYEFKSVPALPQKDTRFTPIPPHEDAALKALAEGAIRAACGESDALEKAKAQYPEFTVPDVQTAVIVELARYCGLTRKEIKAIRWNWFENDVIDGSPYIAVHERPKTDYAPAFATKKNAKNGNVYVAADRLERWRKALQYTPKKRLECLFDVDLQMASEWVGQFIPEREKTLHELRKMAGSDVYTRSGSLAEAATFLRDTPMTVEKFYAALTKRVAAL